MPGTAETRSSLSTMAVSRLTVVPYERDYVMGTYISRHLPENPDHVRKERKTHLIKAMLVLRLLLIILRARTNARTRAVAVRMSCSLCHLPGLATRQNSTGPY